MSFFFCRAFLNLLRFPRTILWGNLLLTIVMGFGFFFLQKEFSLLNLFHPNSSVRLQAEKFTKEYSSLGELILLSESEDGNLNLEFMQTVQKELETWPEVAFVEFKQERDFFNKNKWLYADLKDLRKIHEQLVRVREKAQYSNPLFINLEEEEEGSQSTGTEILKNIASKYDRPMNKYLGSVDQQNLFLRIYPQLELTSLESNRKFFKKVEDYLAKVKPSDLSIHFTGEVYNTLFQQKQLLDETLRSVYISVALVFGLLFFFFLRQPFIPFLTILPIFIAGIWTLGFCGYFIGHINLMVVSLSFMLVGVGSDSLIHLLSRYGEERRKGLGPYIAIENILLETGPAITTANLTSAIAFFCMTLFPLQGFKDFGIIAGMSLLFMWFQSLLVFPALLLLLQKKRKFRVWGKRILNRQMYKPRPVYLWKWGFPLLTLLLVLLLPREPRFESDLSKLSFPLNHADQVLRDLGEYRQPPAVFLGEDPSVALKISSKVKALKEEVPEAGIGIIINSKQLLPERQGEKIHILEEINALLTDDWIDEFPESLQKMAREFKTNAEFTEIGFADLPKSLQKFLRVSATHFPGLVLVFPQKNMPETTAQIRRFSSTLSQIQLGEETLQPTGIYILLAEFLEKTIPNWIRIFLVTLFFAFLLVLFDFKSWQYVFLALIPVLLSYPLALGLMSLNKAPLNPYNLFIIPFLIGYSVDGSLHIVNRYREEGMGSLPFVMRRTGSAVTVANLTSATGFLGLALSNHPTLESIGTLAIMALGVSLFASLFILPAFLNILDATRWSKHFRNRN